MGESRDKENLQGCTMASNYTEYSNSLSDQKQSTPYIGEKPENLLPRKSTESGSNRAEGDQGGIEVSQVENLRRCQHRQNGRKQFECHQCGKCFSSSRNLNDRKRIHSEENPFEKGNLEQHKRTHSGKKPFECEQCGKRLSRAGKLTAHKRTHSGEKPFECKQCGNCYTQAWALKRHKSTHSGEKPFECEQCGKCFTQTGHLKSHKRTHSGKKPFECEQCGKRFSQAGNLTTHKRTHSGDWEQYGRGSELKRPNRRHITQTTIKCEQPDDSYSIYELLCKVREVKQEPLC